MQTKVRVSTFQPFAKAINRQFESMSANGDPLFVVDISRDDLWAHYLNSFPPGSNPIFRTNTEHDCSCCRHFVKNVAGVVRIVDGKLVSVWDVEGLASPYKEVAEAMSQVVRRAQIAGVFRTSFSQFGAERTTECSDGAEIDWHHFYCYVPKAYQTLNVDAEIGNVNSIAGVFRRGLEELTSESLEDILSLIEDKQLYRGEEHERSVRGFRDLHRKYQELAGLPSRALCERYRHLFVWDNVFSPAARFRNSVIGTLAQDLSEGVELETAVKSFESKVAPQNYKRPKSLITPRMIAAAMETIEGLGLEDALHRRHATFSDVSVNNVLFVDNEIRGRMRDGGVADLLMQEARVPTPSFDSATEISIDEFLSNVVPTADSIDMLLENRMTGNFASITAPAIPEAKRILKWSNNFAWTYDGNVADSIKERVKRAGGKIDAYFRASLSWYNYDDLDIHMRTPRGDHIYFGRKAGILDVDMNAGSGRSREPVENMVLDKLHDGVYSIWVNQYFQRETSNVGFEVELECDGILEHFSYDRPMRSDENVDVFKVRVERGQIKEVVPSSKVKSTAKSIEKWGLTTNNLVRVNTLLLSPNHWDDNSVGNRHWFFILDGCHNPDPIRGLYNEFLQPSLEQHRKVFEVLGDKLKCQPSDDQLSGVGFSSTRKDTAVVVVQSGTKKRPYKIVF
ncbi:MAG: hypothetical protein CMK32_09570 [Porticoccaceae bacterium]|nr:hypothetical protein [Porticoccaceae bacterium]